MSTRILEAHDLVKYFPVYRRGILLKKRVGDVHAVDHVSLSIGYGEIFGLVGESGCGKTTAARLILNLETLDSGTVKFEGRDVQGAFRRGGREERSALRRKMQFIFQNPYGSLDPRMTVYDIISEPFAIHRHVSEEEWGERVYRLLGLVGLEEYHAERYPHEFSGGQRQRISIARALAVEPRFIVADEPVSSLDVSIRAQILNLLVDLQKGMGVSYLYISHDLSSVRQISQRVAVMYLGEIVEEAATDELFARPLHPYAIALISAVPIPDPVTKMKRIILPGEVPSPINPPQGCRFHPRCPYATELCVRVKPKFEEALSGRSVACHYWRRLA